MRQKNLLEQLIVRVGTVKVAGGLEGVHFKTFAPANVGPRNPESTVAPPPDFFTFARTRFRLNASA